MKLAFFDDFKLGVVRGDRVIDVSAVVGAPGSGGPQNLINTVIARFEEYRDQLMQAASGSEGRPVADVRFDPPLPRPGVLVCMARNYMENGTLREPPEINAFLKAASGVIGPGGTIELPDVPAAVFEGEAEFAVVIGKRAVNVRAADAMSHVFGYINFIDVSARGLPPEGNTFYQMKSRNTFAPLGPYILTADEVADPQALDITLKVNGVVKQKFNSSDMAHSVARSIEWVSSVHPLEPGDVLATGTNHRGLGPLQDGDSVELETQGLGKLEVRVRDPLKRTWPRETRLERTERGLPPISPQSSGKYAK